MDTPPNLGFLTVNALVCADRVLAPVSAEDGASLHGIREVRQTVRRLAERLAVRMPELTALLTRWQRTRISSRNAEEQLAAHGLAPVARIPCAVGAHRERRSPPVPLALSDPDSSPAIAYQHLANTLERVSSQ